MCIDERTSDTAADAKKREDRIQLLTPGEPGYPALLGEIPDPPKSLYYIGNIDILKERSFAVVGSRRTTAYGRTTAYSLSKRLAVRGAVVVSGMALGIDSCAHRGALHGGGYTVAVLGCGVDVCYPPENGIMKREIEEKGLLLSEYPPGSQPKRYSFPQRNRIISGLCEATIVVQAGISSGALITAEKAAEQGRDVYAVPGSIDSSYHLGSNKLLRDGAQTLAGIEDFLVDMGYGRRDETMVIRTMNRDERAVYDLLCENGEMSLDEMSARLGKPVSLLGGIAAVMEMKGIVFSDMGKIFIAKA